MQQHAAAAATPDVDAAASAYHADADADENAALRAQLAAALLQLAASTPRPGASGSSTPVAASPQRATVRICSCSVLKFISVFSIQMHQVQITYRQGCKTSASAW